MKTIFLKHPSDNEVFAFFPFEKYNSDNAIKTSYAHIGQHSACHTEYALECTEATVTEYIDLELELREIYEGKIENAYLDFHREPTKREINFGEGATHYKEFSPLQYLKPNGEVKTWLKCPIDGLRYYY